jgi:hypothetical protein
MNLDELSKEELAEWLEVILAEKFVSLNYHNSAVLTPSLFEDVYHRFPNVHIVKTSALHFKQTLEGPLGMHVYSRWNDGWGRYDIHLRYMGPEDSTDILFNLQEELDDQERR